MVLVGSRFYHYCEWEHKQTEWGWWLSEWKKEREKYTNKPCKSKWFHFPHIDTQHIFSHSDWFKKIENSFFEKKYSISTHQLFSIRLNQFEVAVEANSCCPSILSYIRVCVCVCVDIVHHSLSYHRYHLTLCKFLSSYRRFYIFAAAAAIVHHCYTHTFYETRE